MTPMATFKNHPVLKSVRQALGRSATPTEIPAPPELDEPLIRLVHSDFGLPELFAARARENKMRVTFVSPEDAAPMLTARLKELGIASAAYPVSKLIDQLEILPALAAAGVSLLPWGPAALNPTYDVDAGITDAYAAVAETGSVVIRPTASHGRALSLVPNYHFILLEPKNFLPDLVDLFQKLPAENDPSGLILITGPSKTADIEMNLVTGVHGPGHIEIFILK